MSDVKPAERTVTINGDLPTLRVPAPTCGHCENPVDVYPDGASCESCGVSWKSIDDGLESYPLDGGDTCGLVVENHSRVGWEDDHTRYAPTPARPCILPKGHDDEAGHLNPYDVVMTPTEQDGES